MKIGNGAFIGCNGFTGNLVIGNSVVMIEDCAFMECSGFDGELTIPSSVVTIGFSAFSGCSGLIGNLTIPSFVTLIGDEAFLNCSNLTSITILTETPPTIYSWTFFNCPKSIPVYVPCGSVEAYQSAAYWNEFTNIQETCLQAQTIDLAADWSWWSTSLDITLGELKEALGSNGLKIVAQDGKFASYNTNNGTWSGNLQSIELGKMYKVRTNEACSITLNGAMADPNEHPITLHSGNNWIGFISNESLSLDDAFGDYVPTDRDVIKASNGKATYYQGYGWQGSLNTLEPGKGYIYKSNATESRTFTYPSAK